MAISVTSSRKPSPFRFNRLFLAASLSALALLVGGCAETQLAAHAAKSVGGQGNGSRGGYKVGDPYQIQGTWYYPAEDYNYDETGVASWYGPGFHEKMTANGEQYDMNDLTAAHRTLPMPSFVRVTNLDNGRSIVVRINDRGPYARGRIIDLSRRAAQLLGVDQVGTAKVRVSIMADESRQIAQQLKSGQGTQVASASGAGVGPRRVDTRPGEPPPTAAPRTTVAATPLAAPPSQAQTRAAPQPSPATPPPGAAPAPAPVAASLPDPTGPVASVAPRKTQLYVQAGSFSNIDNANRLSQKLKTAGPTKVVPVTVGNQQFYRVRIGPLASVEQGDKALDQVINAGNPEARLIAD